MNISWFNVTCFSLQASTDCGTWWEEPDFNNKHLVGVCFFRMIVMIILVCGGDGDGYDDGSVRYGDDQNGRLSGWQWPGTIRSCAGTLQSTTT